MLGITAGKSVILIGTGTGTPDQAELLAAWLAPVLDAANETGEGPSAVAEEEEEDGPGGEQDGDGDGDEGWLKLQLPFF